MRIGKYEIQKPIWQGELRKRCIGIADFRLGNVDAMDVTVAYTKKDGTKSHPGIFSLPVEKIRSYPTQVVGGGITLHVVPLEDWEWRDE